MRNINKNISEYVHIFIILLIILNSQNIFLLIGGLVFISLLFYIFFKQISIKYLSFYLIVYNLIPWDPLFSSNQSIYFSRILKNLNYSGLQDDWYSNFSAPYPVFNYITEIIIKITSLSVINILPWIFLCAGLMAIEKISLKFQVPKNKTYLVSFVILFLIIWNKIPPIGDERIPELLSPIQQLIGVTQIFLGGLSSFSIFSFVYQPQAFDLLFLFGIYYFIDEKYVTSFSISIFVALFHYWLLLPTAVLYIIYIIKQSKDRNKTYFLILFFIPVIFLIVFYNIAGKIDINQSIELDATQQESVDMILDERIGIHRISIPKLTFGSWFYSSTPFAFEIDYGRFEVKKVSSNTTILSGLSASHKGSSLPLEYLLLCFFGVRLSLNNNLRLFLIISNFIWISTFVLNAIIDLPILKTFQPWRISGICIFLSSLIVFSKLINQLNFKLPNFLLTTLLLLGISFLTPSEGKISTYSELQESTISINDKLFVDSALNDFSLNSGGRSIYVSKNFPYSNNGIIQWEKRYLLNERILNSNNCEDLKSLIISSKFNSKIVIYDSEVKKRNVGQIKDCDIEIVDLFNLRN